MSNTDFIFETEQAKNKQRVARSLQQSAESNLYLG
jgi:hypothetical protein